MNSIRLHSLYRQENEESDDYVMKDNSIDTNAEYYLRYSKLTEVIIDEIKQIIIEQDPKQDKILECYLKSCIDTYKNNHNIVTEDDNIKSDCIRYLKRHIECNYDHDISLEDLACKLHMNRNYLSRLFKDETGISFTDCLTSFRIKLAKILITSDDISIAEIAYIVGYKDANYFSRTFKNTTGYSPTDYRKNFNYSKTNNIKT